jgi:serine protease Do
LGLEQLARQITVRVLIGNPKQSGILIRRRSEEQRQIYTVLTYEKNSESKSYRIQTNDNQIHDVKTSRKLVQGDLLELEFFSTNNYQIASLGDSSSLMGGTEVFTAGYIFEPNSLGWKDMFKFTKGKIIDEKTVLKYPGSQFIMLGLTNNVQEEMIGGPLLNSQGKLVGINGRNNYISGGWSISSDTNPEYKYSWAIPIEFYTP